MCVCVADSVEGGKPDETNQLVSALEETILQTEREDTVLRSDCQGDGSQSAAWVEARGRCLWRLMC